MIYVNDYIGDLKPMCITPRNHRGY